ncbi:MAG: TatA/E family twin arginine-targeting protein translocase [Cyanobacteriota bacterium]|jgi:sec-independent protein translocase protein TatA
MNFFGIGLPEMAVIAAIGLLVFGPKRLPELGKTLGRTLRGFQSASQEFEKEFRTAIASEGTVAETAEVAAPAPLPAASASSSDVSGSAAGPADNTAPGERA